MNSIQQQQPQPQQKQKAKRPVMAETTVAATLLARECRKKSWYDFCHQLVVYKVSQFITEA
jgi:hypothetical protein